MYVCMYVYICICNVIHTHTQTTHTHTHKHTKAYIFEGNYLRHLNRTPKFLRAVSGQTKP
jgi:hypothetical protein